MTIPALFDVELRRACRLVAQDRRQRWVYQDGPNVVRITETPVPFRDAVSVYWMPCAGGVAYSWRPRVPAHPAVGAL